MRVSGVWVARLLAGLALAGCGHAGARTARERSSAKVVVVGTGEAEADPDIARVRLGVEAASPQVSNAVARAGETMKAVIQALERAGVASADLRTISLSIQRDRPPTPLPAGGDGRGRAPEPYRVTNMLIVTVRDLGRIGSILEQAIAAGANELWGLDFALDEPAALREQARREAVDEAKTTALQLAGQGGVLLGPPLWIEDMSAPGVPAARYGMALEKAALSVPIESGRITVQQQVRIVFEVVGR